jgi:hypothetical protein
MNRDEAETEHDEAGAEGAVEVRSYIDRRAHTVIAHGRFEPLVAAYLRHAATLGPLPDRMVLEMMGQAISAATLRLALLPPDQFMSWTFNLMAPPLNLFLAGDNSSFQITGRAFTSDVRTVGTCRLYVETQRPRLKPATSVVDFEGTDVLAAMQAYYERALQMRARSFVLGEGEMMLIEGLPNVNRSWFAGIDVEAARDLLASGLEEIEARNYRFRCGCNLERITLIIQELFGQRQEELLEGEDHVEVQCPRCGRSWTISRDVFEGVDA